MKNTTVHTIGARVFAVAFNPEDVKACRVIRAAVVRCEPEVTELAYDGRKGHVWHTEQIFDNVLDAATALRERVEQHVGFLEIRKQRFVEIANKASTLWQASYDANGGQDFPEFPRS